MELLSLGNKAYDAAIALRTTLPKITLTAANVKISEFFETKTQKQRYDVLMHLTPKDSQHIDSLRATFIRNVVDADLVAKFSMNPPHVTHSIHYSEAAANAAMAALKQSLPITVEMTGFTIDLTLLECLRCVYCRHDLVSVWLQKTRF